MATASQLSPLEQLEQYGTDPQPQSFPQPTATDSQLSPLEQLEQMPDPTTPQPTATPAANSGSGSRVLDSLAAMGRSPLRPTAQDTQFYQEHPALAAGAGVTGLTAGAGLAIAPELGPVFAHLDKLKKIVDYAQKLSMADFGYEQAKKLYKEYVGSEK